MRGSDYLLQENKIKAFYFRESMPRERIVLEVTIARKVLPHPQGIKGSMHNFLNKGLFMTPFCQDEI
jgi:hypothetical protein